MGLRNRFGRYCPRLGEYRRAGHRRSRLEGGIRRFFPRAAQDLQTDWTLILTIIRLVVVSQKMKSRCQPKECQDQRQRA